MMRQVQITYMLAIPLFLLSVMVHKPFTLWGIQGYYSALSTPISAYFFHRLTQRYPWWSIEIKKSALGLALITRGLIWLLTQWPLAEGSLVNEHVWKRVTGQTGIVEWMSAYALVFLATHPTPAPPKDKGYLGSLGPLAYGSLQLCLQSVVIYILVGLYNLWLGREDKAYAMLGSIFWACLSTWTLTIGEVVITYPYAKARQAREETEIVTEDDRLYGRLMSLFIGLLLLTNIVSVRYLSIGQWLFTAGLLTYPFTFLLTDIISELYGRRHAEEAVIVGLGASIWMGLCTGLLVRLSGEVSIDRCFSQFFSFAPGMILGSMIAYLLGQWLDVQLFYLLKKATRGRYLWLRNNVGTMISQLVDTVVFGIVAWDIWPRIGSGIIVKRSVWYSIVLNEYLGKLIMALMDTPLLYLSLYAIRKVWKKKIY